ncbi:MAG: ATP-binding protein [Pseudobdellovibrio sp.]
MNKKLLVGLGSIIFLLSLPIIFMTTQLLKITSEKINANKMEILGVNLLKPTLKYYLLYSQATTREEKDNLFLELEKIYQKLKPLQSVSESETNFYNTTFVELTNLDKILKLQMSSENNFKFIFSFIQKLITNSNLILDPEKKTYFTISAVGIQIPSYVNAKNSAALLKQNMNTLSMSQQYALNLIFDLRLALQNQTNYPNTPDDNKILSLTKELENIIFSEIPISIFVNIIDATTENLNTDLNDRLNKNQLSMRYILSRSLIFWMFSVFLALIIYFKILNVSASFQDTIQQQKKTLEASQKLSALGEISANIGHEIANPLTIIRASANSLENSADHPLSPKTILKLQRIVKMTDRITQIIKSIKILAHNQDGDPGSAQNLKASLEEMTILLQDKINLNSVVLKIDISDDLPNCISTESELVQVLLNLTGNSIDALDNQSEKIISFSTSIENNMLKLSIFDNGPGIPAEIQDRIFESLYTTKPIGKGTGLGLSITRQIMERHKGRITIDTKYTSGAKFDLYFCIA